MIEDKDVYFLSNPAWYKQDKKGRFVLTDKAPPKAVESYRAAQKFCREHRKELPTELLAKILPD